VARDAFNVVVEDQQQRLNEFAVLATQIQTGTGPFCYRCVEGIRYGPPCFVNKVPPVAGKCEEHKA
jgi:hypothetical protein